MKQVKKIVVLEVKLFIIFWLKILLGITCTDETGTTRPGMPVFKVNVVSFDVDFKGPVH